MGGNRYMTRLFSFLLAGVLLFSSVPQTQPAANEATSDEAAVVGKQQAAAMLEEVFVAESGALADGTSGDYVGIPSEAFEAGQTFDQVTVDEDNQMTDIDGNEIGVFSEEMEGAVSEKELSRPRMSTHMLASAGEKQSIEINDFRAVLKMGATLNENGDYVWQAPNGDELNTFTFRIIYAFSGVGEYEENQIHIKIPKSILRNRGGELADLIELPVPAYDEEGLTDKNLFVYQEDGDNIDIFNRLPCSAAQSGYISDRWVYNTKR